MAKLGFNAGDFEVFTTEGFSERMGQIYQHVRPKLVRLGEKLAPEVASRLHLEFFPHVAKHARRTINPPPETWCAFGPSARGYKRYAFLGLCVSMVGVHARLVVKSEADHRPAMAVGIRRKARELAGIFSGTRLGRYERWNFQTLPAGEPADTQLFETLAAALDKKTGGIDLGFGWAGRAAERLECAELIDAFAELEPLYRVCRAVS